MRTLIVHKVSDIEALPPDTRTLSVRQMFPYGMRKLSDGSWMLFNRQYGPMGTHVCGCNMEDPEFVLHRMWLTGVRQATLRNLCIDGSGTGDTIYFYRDGCQPESSEENWNSYAAKLQILMRLRTK